MQRVITGLEQFSTEKNIQSRIKGRTGLLCHAASLTPDFEHAAIHFKKILGKNLVSLFGPQHGFVTDVQDNMIETKHFVHPYFKIPVYSLYSETRIPTDEMLEGLDTLVIDLQDVGTRVYTYITTLGLIIDSLHKKNIKLVILDRPNPVSGNFVEGNVLEPEWKSFVGHLEMPMRHALTMGEVAKLKMLQEPRDVEIDIVTMKNWKREMYFQDTGLPWVNPSPNLPTMEGAIAYCGTVLFEGCSVSEGRGTTRSLEILGAAGIEPFAFADKVREKMQKFGIEGAVCRPQAFVPTFHKYAGKTCGGVQIQITDPARFEAWKLGQILLRTFKTELGNDFQWSEKPYEYQFDRLAIDFINGSETLRHWVDNDGTPEALNQLAQRGMPKYLEQKKSCELYS